jgi:hypothetical protein
MALWSNTDVLTSQPKWLATSNTLAAGTRVVFVDASEAQTPEAKASGIKGAGWYAVNTYTDSGAQTRYKTELLVAMRVAANVAGDRPDGADDDLVPDLGVITIGTQPANQSVIEGATATFTVAATVTTDSTITYQWFENINDVWTAVTGATSASLAIADTTILDDDGREFRVVVSAAGAPSVTSTAATLTVTE